LCLHWYLSSAQIGLYRWDSAIYHARHLEIDTVWKVGLRILLALNYWWRNLSRHQMEIKAGTFRNIVSKHFEIQYGQSTIAHRIRGI